MLCINWGDSVLITSRHLDIQLLPLNINTQTHSSFKMYCRKNKQKVSNRTEERNCELCNFCMSSSYVLLDGSSFRLENLIHLQTSFDFGAVGVLTSLTFVLPESDPILAEKQKLDLMLIYHMFKITHFSRSFEKQSRHALK